MNEADWLTSEDPAAMLGYLEGRAGERKVRLFSVGCLRHYMSRLRSWRRLVETVELLERYADGQVPAAEMEEAREGVQMAPYGAPEFEQFAYQAVAAAVAEDPFEAARNVCESLRLQEVREVAYESAPGENEQQRNAAASQAECRRQAGMLREVFGNPFRPAPLRPDWLHWDSGAVVAMARVMYEGGQLGELPYLADALEDAGCDHAEVLRHLRQAYPPHVRGCWVVDQILGHD
jgi:hypothetical protein